MDTRVTPANEFGDEAEEHMETHSLWDGVLQALAAWLKFLSRAFELVVGH